MGRSQETFNKKEREKQKQKKKQEKLEKKQERQSSSRDGNDLGSMLAYIDENGNITSTPPDPSRRRETDIDSIQIGVPKQQPADPADAIREGVVTMFNQSKGYGFIKDKQTGESIFVHINSATEPIGEGDKVIFEVEMNHKGKNAVDVKKGSKS